MLLNVSTFFRIRQTAIKESHLFNTRNAVRDNCVLAASNKGIRCSLNNRIAIFATIVSVITAFNYYRGKGGATPESGHSNTRYAFRDSNRGEGGAITESPTSNTRYAARDSNGCEERAIIESIISNTRNAVANGNRCESVAIIESPTSNTHYAVRDGDSGKGAAI